MQAAPPPPAPGPVPVPTGPPGTAGAASQPPSAAAAAAQSAAEPASAGSAPAPGAKATEPVAAPQQQQPGPQAASMAAAAPVPTTTAAPPPALPQPPALQAPAPAAAQQQQQQQHQTQTQPGTAAAPSFPQRQTQTQTVGAAAAQAQAQKAQLQRQQQVVQQQPQAAVQQQQQPLRQAVVAQPQQQLVQVQQQQVTQVQSQPRAQPQQQVVMQQQQQHFPHQGLNGGWQSDKDYQERRKMIAKIVHLLQQRKPNAPQEWLKKLPQMAKRLEESLYRSAKSFDEYNDANTLKHRLQQLAVNIGMRTKKLQQQQQAQQQQQQLLQQQRTQQQQTASGGVVVQAPGQAQPQQAPATVVSYRQQQSAQQQQQQQVPAQPQPAPQHQQQIQQPHQAGPMQAPPPQPVAVAAPQPQQQHSSVAPQQRLVNMSDINPMMAQPAAATQQQQQAVQPQQQAYAAVAPQAAPGASLQQHAAQPAVAAPANGARVATANGSGNSNNTQVSDRQQVLRHQQQRLLLLRHAAKCQHEDGRCPVTPHCAGMKRLWKHIAECKNQKCLVPHCVSSRYVLSHYHRCKDVRCPVCGPVREAIHRSHEKQKQMQALKQRHQQAVQQTQQQQQQQQLQQAVLQPPQLAGVPSGQIAPTPGVQVIHSAPPVQGEPPNKRRKSSAVGAAGLQAAPAGYVAGQQQAQQLPVQQRSSLAQLQQQQVAHQQVSGQVLQAPGVLRSQGPLAAAPATALAQPGRSNLPYGQPSGSVPVAGAANVASVPGIAFANGQVIMPKHTGPKPQEDHTLINCFSVEQIEKHLAALNKGLVLPPNKLKTKCLEVLKILQSHQHAWVFNAPVDPVELGLPDYFEVIKKPMDLGSVRRKLENGVYHNIEDFEKNVLLTFDNAMLYNPDGSVVYNMAKEMKAKFQMDFQKLIDALNEEEDIKRKKGEACLLCGCEKLLFEPPVFYCNGANCQSKRIRRNSYYYVGGNNQYHWCHQCFQDLRDGSTIDLGDIQIVKSSLVKKKNDEVHEESWVQCDRCERWVHQICALFNTRQNKDQRSEYACPRCTVEERKRRGNLEPTSSTPMAEDLPRTKLSEFIEKHVREKMDSFIELKSQNLSKEEKISIEEARKKMQMGGNITIRQVTSMDRKLEVRDRMKKRYAFKNYPEEFTFRCKCFVVFQNLDGVDVMIFGLYVYEHDENNPPPNKRAVYVSYLDSVHYMRPRSMRTFIYHEILISYLDYVRRRGFSTAHIWACPPLKGDDYILYAKPEDQKTPKDDRLRQWYMDMLVECQRRGIVGKLTNMYDLYFDPKQANDATVVPYMDGDYFPAEAENIIKDIEEGKTGKNSSTAGQKKKKDKKQKKKSGRGGTRSTGLDEDALKASGLSPPGTDPENLKPGERDYVMVKLGETIQPMKESFIVAYLAWDGADPKNMVVPKAVEEYRQKHGVTWKLDGSDDAENESEGASGKDSTDSNNKDEPGGNDTTANCSNTESNDNDEDNNGVTDEKASAADGDKDGDVADNKATVDKSKEEGVTDAEVNAEEAKETPSSEVGDDTPGEGNGASVPVDSEKASAPKEQSQGTEESDETSPKPDDSKPADSKSDDSKPADSKSDDSKPDDSKSNDSKPDDSKSNDSKPDDSKPDDSKPDDSKSDDSKPDDSKPDDSKPGDSKSGDSKPDDSTPDTKMSTETTEKATDTSAAAIVTPMEGVTKTDDEDSKKSSTVDEPPKDKDNNSAPPVETTLSNAGAQSAPDSTNSSAPDGTESSTAAQGSPKANVNTVNMSIREGKFAAMEKKKKELEGDKEDDADKKKNKKEETSKTVMVKDSKGRIVKVLDDDDEELDCEFLNNRQAFLNLCQGNHYQFDHLRRAKHTSMMVLWHLHNRDAPKFVQQCATCSREILTGYRFHCPTCADFDQCHECVQNPNIPRHAHQLKPIPIATGQQAELSDAQRKERQRSIQLHMTLLQHAATCTNPKCPSANCTKMKGLLKHGAQCQIKATGGCNVCKRIWALLQIHARQCKLKSCQVPNCMAIRERVRQLKKQQQAMDDRRRQEMNRAYRGKR